MLGRRQKEVSFGSNMGPKKSSRLKLSRIAASRVGRGGSLHLEAQGWRAQRRAAPVVSFGLGLARTRGTEAVPAAPARPRFSTRARSPVRQQRAPRPARGQARGALRPAIGTISSVSSALVTPPD
jgi:hypothetical protein